MSAAPERRPSPRRAGWIRIALFFVLGGVCVVLGHYEVAALFAAVGALVAWIDLGIAGRAADEERGGRSG